MPNFLTEELAEYLRLRGPSNPDTRIFPSMTKHLLHHEMTRGAKIAGVKRIRIHDLRHSHASMLVAMGMTVPSIAASLSQWMQAIYRELITARDDERALDADVVWMARSIAEEFSAISSAGQTRNANETMRSIERS